MQISVRLSDEKCSRTHNIHLSLSGQSEESLKSLSSYFIGQTEPKILRLVTHPHGLWILVSEQRSEAADAAVNRMKKGSSFFG